MKTIILTWTQRCKNFDHAESLKNGQNYWGLGDLIRGTIKLFQLSKKMNFNLIVNYNLHPISLYLKERKSEYDEFILQNKNNIEFVYPGNVEKYIMNSRNNILYFLTNDWCDDHITSECKEFIKDILSPNDELLYLINKYNLNNYNILHMRFGDNLIINKNIINDKFTMNVKNIIINNLDDKLYILVCDSSFVKNELQNDNFFENKNLSFINVAVGHIGYEQNCEKIKNTLLEFFLISKSNLIKTYTIYGWTSGFVYWISKIYNIPLIKIN